MALEAKIQGTIMKYLKLHGCKAIKIVEASVAGHADIVGCYKGYYFEMEVKIPGAKSRPLQIAKGEECLKAGGMWFEVHSLDEAKNGLNYIKDHYGID